MDISKSISLKSFGRYCPECGDPTSTIPMIYKNGEPVKPMEDWVTDKGIYLECGCCVAEGADRDNLDGSIFFVEVRDVYAPEIWEALKKEAEEINARYRRDK
jgi:hypothetical protein